MLSFFEKSTNAYPNKHNQQIPNSLFGFCWFFSYGMKLPLILMSILSACIAVLEVWLFRSLGNIVDWLQQDNMNLVWQLHQSSLIMMAILLLVILPLLSFLHSAIVHQALLGNYPMSIRYIAHKFLLKQSVSFYHDEFAGAIASKVMQTSLSVRETVMKLLDVFVFITVYFISILVLLFLEHIYLSLAMSVWLLLYILVQIYFIPKLKRVSKSQANARAEMTGAIVDSYSNIMTVKLFSHHQREISYGKKKMHRFLKTVYQQMRFVTALNVGIQTINYFLVFSIAAIALYLWDLSLITAGVVSFAIALALRLNGMAYWIMWEVSAVFENIGTVSDGMATLTKPLTVQDTPNAKPLQLSQGVIEFRQVLFSYQKNTVFNNFNLKIDAGEKIGLIGRSGAGKSTLVNLLLRFFELDSGQILVDQQDISKVQQDSLRANIAVVTQDTSLLHRTVRENLKYGQPDASDEQMIMACKQAFAYDFIQSLQDANGNQGFDAQVGERGVKLSGGQRQRIALARVLLKNASILILDEATSALDSKVEGQIQQSLQTIMSGKTVIAIAHRLSTIASMDRLIVLDQGRIAEMGNHKQLLANKGLYAQLWSHQSGGFIEQPKS